jgi:uncharacterized protein (TIGR03435 family)
MHRRAIYVVPLLTAFVLGTSCLPLLGQAADKKPSFEVASIKLNVGDSRGGGGGLSAGGRWSVINTDLITLVMLANEGLSGVPMRRQIVDAPDWASSEHYDINAITTDDLREKRVRELYTLLPQIIQHLLEDRFQLGTHHEARQMPIYELVLAKTGRALGPRLRPTTVDCRTDPQHCMIQSGRGHFDGPAVGLTMLVQMLSFNVDRVIVDHTGLQGLFELNLEWTPDHIPGPNGDSTFADNPSLFTALQKQLGLKLEATKGPVDVVVIDHVERPTPD